MLELDQELGHVGELEASAAAIGGNPDPDETARSGVPRRGHSVKSGGSSRTTGRLQDGSDRPEASSSPTWPSSGARPVLVAIREAAQNAKVNRIG